MQVQKTGRLEHKGSIMNQSPENIVDYDRNMLLIPVTLAIYVMIPVLYSCYDFLMICISDSIRLDTLWHETKGIYMRVSLFGLFLRCTSLMGP